MFVDWRPLFSNEICLVHIQRMCKIQLSAYPKSVASFELREIVCKINFIDNEIKKQYWIKEFLDWYVKHKIFLNEKSFSEETGRYWYTHKMVRRCFTVIKKALRKCLLSCKIKKSQKQLLVQSLFWSFEGQSKYSSGTYKNSKKKVYSMVSFL